MSKEVLVFPDREALSRAAAERLVEVVEGVLYGSLLEQEHALYPYPAGSWGPEEARRLLDGGSVGGKG